MNAPTHPSRRRGWINFPARRWLPNLPLTMKGRLRRCWLLAYRAPVADVTRHLPFKLKPVSFGGFGFWNVVICEIEGMRPRGFPKFLGITYRHAAYRIYVRHQNGKGASVAGLYFLRSDCDSRILATGGNLLTSFQFHPGKIGIEENPLATLLEVNAKGGNGHATITYDRPVRIADGSPFQSVQEAGEFLEYAPYGISVTRRRVEILPIRRDETQWKPRVVAAHSDRWEFLKNEQTHLEIAYEIAPIDYEWLPAYPL